MKKLYSALITGVLLLFFAGEAFSQQPLVSEFNKKELKELASKSNTLYVQGRQQALLLAQSHGWVIRRKTKNGGLMVLQGLNKRGFPIYLITDDNIISAATTGTNTVQPGGVLGLNLSGSSTSLNNQLAIWDGGWVYAAHQEFAGKTITIRDTNSSVIDHATHVSGTMLAKGVYPPAKGMAFNATTLQSYDFNNDVAEMSIAAPGLLLSNHSYGDVAGWNFDGGSNRWEWYGIPGDTVDFNFGFYGDRAQAYDKIAYNAPNYLIVEAAGNSRGSTGPTVGGDYYGFKSASDQTFVDKGPRPASISSNAGYDCISSTANAKNILTVGAINPLPYGPTNAQNINITYFSSWGPTDDGRVKPDLVGNGLNVLSAGSASSTNYITLSGTSQATPNITGSLYLLQEYEHQQTGHFMRAATLKGLACHTAFDAGNVGPDYIYGWGLLDMKRAAQAITDNGTKSLLKENILNQGGTQTINVVASGNGALSATISWTDPEGTITPDGVINDRTPKLVNDLDIRISDGTTTFKPWVLDPDHPSVAATTGDNKRDNVEQVYIAGAIPGKAYTITVSHKGTLKSGSQPYSLIVTGIGGATYCASAPTSNADSRINNVTISNLNNTPPAGCTTYSDYTNLTVQLEQSKSYPLSLTLGTCGANFDKIAKVFIDWNGNGTFEASELVATTGVINATGTYTTNITVPASVTPGNFSLMRVVLTETADPSTINACGAYAKGETQDYRVQFLQTSIDAGVIAILNPAAGGNCSGATPVTVTIKNFGSTTISQIPVVVTITAPDNTVTTFNQLYNGSLASSAQDDFTFTSTFNITAGSTYIITAATNLQGDLVPGNNQVTKTVVIDNPPVVSALAANYCNATNTYLLSGSGDGELLWYQNSADAIPFAYGSPVTTAQPPGSNNTYYAGLNDFSGTIGPATKNVFTAGGYNQFTPAINVFTRIPVIIESARLYIGYPGKITFIVTDSSGETVSSTTINATATRSNPLPGPQSDDPNDQGQVYNLNLLLPAAGSYSISALYDNTATIYRNNGGVSGYPFKIGDVFSITGNTATSSSDTAYYKNFYYFLYDVHLKSPGCASAVKQAVTVSKPMVTQNGTTLSSSFAAGNQWYLNGIAIFGATGQTFSPTKSGTYRVDATLNSGCISQSDNFVYVIVSKNPGDNDIGLTVFPIPANGLLNVVFAAKTTTTLNMSLINSAGQLNYTENDALSAGNFSTVINVSNLTPGTYILKLLLGQKEYTRKITIDR